MVILEVRYDGQRDLTVFQLDSMQCNASVIIDDKHGLSPGQKSEFVYSGDSDQTLRNEVTSIVILVPTEAQLDPTSDKCFQLLCGEASERRRGRPEHWIFSAQLYELIHPDVTALYDPIEVLASL